MPKGQKKTNRHEDEDITIKNSGQTITVKGVVQVALLQIKNGIMRTNCIRGMGSITNNGFKLHVLEGDDSEIYEQDGIMHVIGGKKGGVFRINNTTITMEKDGTWSMKSKDTITQDMNDVFMTTIKGKRVNFSKKGTPLKSVISKITTSGSLIINKF